MRPTAALMACAVVAISGPLRAEVTAVAPATSISPPMGTAPVRWPDVAWDGKSGVYLAVSGAGALLGQFVSGDGAALGDPFVVQENAGSFAQAPRVVATSGAFLVTWHETVGSATRVRARIVRHGAPALTGDFDVSPLGTNWEMGAAVAYADSGDEALIAWQSPDGALAAQRVSGAGSLVGTTIAIDPGPRYHRDPAVAWNRDTREFVVAYGGCEKTDDCFAEARRIAGGAVVGGAIAIDAGAKAVYTPELAYDAVTHEMLVVWHRRADKASFFSRRILGDGTLAAPSSEITDRYTSYDANGLAWNPVSNTFLFVTHSDSAVDAAIELSAAGIPLDPKDGVSFGPSSASGNFNPRVAAAHDRPEWLAVTSTAFATLTAQRFTTTTRDPTGVPPDAGTVDASVPSDAGSVVDASVDGSRSSSIESSDVDEGGCSCRTGARSHARPWLFAILLITAVARERARPRSKAAARRDRRGDRSGRAPCGA